MKQNRLKKETKTGRVWVSDKEMAPRVQPHPGTRPTETEALWTREF
jgi:hypothetical protein